MNQAETVDFPFPGRIILVRNHTLFEQGPESANTKQGGKDMVAVNHVIMPPKNLPPDYRDISQVHPCAPSFPVTVQYVTLHPESLKRGYLLLDKDAKDGMVPGRIIGCDMKDSHKN